MPVVQTPAEDEVNKATLEISSTPYESQVVDTRKEAYDPIASFLAGYKWDNDYYPQVQRRDNAAASFQPDLPLPYGEYKRIRGFELVVSTPLSHKQASGDVLGFNSTGTAYVYSVVTPNLGDVFVADVGNGQNALFMITSVNRATIFPESATEVEFKLRQIADKEIMDSLNKRVIQTLYFDRENFRNGLKALLTEEDVNVNRRLNVAYRRLIHLYMKDFYSQEYNTLIVPGQGAVTYDPYIVRFIKATMDNHLHPDLINITQLGVEEVDNSREFTLWDAILRLDVGMLYSVSRQAGINWASQYMTRPTMFSLYFSGVKQVVIVTDPIASADNPEDILAVSAPLQMVEAGKRQTDMRSILPALTGGDIPAIPDNFIRPVTYDNHYVFSQAFYDDLDDKTVLERMVIDRMNGKVINLSQLADMAEYAVRFDNLERFYYIPIILTLIKLAPGVL